MDTKNGTIGGGNILKYWNQNSGDSTSNLNTSLIRQFLLLPYVKLLIVLLIVVIAVILILKIFEVKNPLKGKALTNELKYLDQVKKRDASIIKANRTMQSITKIIEKSPLALSKSYIEYWSYNLSRANIRIPGGSRIIKPEEFNAIISVVELFVVAIGVIITIFVNMPFGVMLIILAITLASVLPMGYVRSIVISKDSEIVENFADFYLMIHYVLMASAGTPLTSIMKSYDKTTDSEDMHRFIDVCIHYIDTYGEYEGTRYIAKQYREINEVGKLMRLIRQANEGGDVRAELIGFRNELLNAKRYELQKRMDKLVLKAKMSFNILVPVLIQAIISAMAIYLDDLSLTSTLF
jgi:hypothetical protein